MFRGRIAAEFPAGWEDNDLIASVEGVSLHEE
jgi:simple sugar transport system ATP-binding protein